MPARTEIIPELAQRMQRVANRRGLSPHQAAAACGVSAEAWHGWMRGRCNPSTAHIKQFCELTGTSADWLLGLEQAE